MRFERKELIKGKENVWLDCYIANKISEKSTRKALLIIPGGGYACVCNGREGEPIALAFMHHGFNAFVLNYSVGKGNATFPTPLIEASLAMKHIKDNAQDYGIDPEQVFATGFSAGGHLCCSLGTMWHLDEVNKAIDMPFGYNKPKGILPIYPVVSSDNSIWHAGSFQNIASEPTQEQYDRWSIEKWVDEKSSPAFIVHTSEDKCVKVNNSIVLANAYANASIPFELHIFEKMGHGMALADEITCKGYANPHNARWVELAVEWMNDLT